MGAKRWLGVAAAGVVATPVALGVGVVMLVSVIAENNDKGRAVGTWPTATSLRIGGADGVPARYADLILAAAAACDQGLPPSILAAQIWAESRFDPTAVSRDSAGNPIASGMAQFIPATWASTGTATATRTCGTPRTPSRVRAA